MADELIIGATSPTYTLTPTDVGRTVYCRVTGTNVAGTAFVNAVAVGPILAPAALVLPSNTVAPSIGAGGVTVSQTLSTTTGTWAGTAPITYTYQWKRGTTNVGSGLANYITTSADVGFNIACVVTAHNVVGTASISSNLRGPVAALPAGVPPTLGTPGPTIADITPSVGELLHVTSGTWTGDATITFGYEWHRVDATPVAPSNSIAPSIADITPQVGETLHVVQGTWIGDATISYSFQWKRIAGGTTNIGIDDDDYTLVPVDLNALILCTVTATNAVGSSSRDSNTVGPVVMAPANIVAPAIADITPTEGTEISCTAGTWDGSATITYTYEWHRVI